jgi:hypothetical protein
MGSRSGVHAPLLADLASSIRKELDMDLDRKRFEEGVKATNSATLQLLRDELLPGEP